MAAVINTNVASLNAQRNLNTSQTSLATSLQRLSSGLRINSAKDDAAGLAISERFSTQIRGLNQAIRNANDGISLSQTAEGALSEMGNNLQRIRELAVQAANSTNSASDRAAINREVQERLAEIGRTSSQTTFNGQKILDGSFGSANFQVGANAGETIQIGLDTSMRNNAIGQIATETSATAIGASTGGSNTLSPTTMLFSAESDPGSGGSIALTGLTQTNFANAGAAEVKASNTQEFTGSADFSGAGALAQFDVTIGATTVGVTLNADYTDADGVAQAIEDQLNAAVGDGSQITVTNTSGTFKIEAATALTTSAIKVDSVDANGAAAGFTESEGTVGAAAGAAASNVSFKVNAGTAQEKTVTLDGDYTDQDGVVAAIQADLGADYSVAKGGAGEYTITNNTIGSSAVTISANSTALQGGWVGVGSGTAGDPALSGKDAKFTVDNLSITLNDTYTSFDEMAADLEDKIQAGGGAYANYTVTNNNGALKITKGSGDQTEVLIGADVTATASQAANATAAGFGVGAGTEAEGVVGGGSITLSNLTIKAGDGSAVSMSGTYSNAKALAEAINKNVSGVYATANDDGELTLNSSSNITLGGSDAATLGFSSSITASNGSLESVSTLTVDDALATIQRVDSALTSVNSLRSTFGAIQNRFESVISNLSTSAENMTAARSRIQDADFAAETANLTRGQILQQAGTAMLAQANSLPNGVLALLRG